MIVRQANSRFRRLAVLTAVAFVFGVSVHGLCQAVEHRHHADDAAALCVTAIAVLAAVALVGGARRREAATPPSWPAVLVPIRAGAQTGPGQVSPAWLQRFLN
ncbi:MAG: hypothetical protein ACM3QU_12820 [Verrucomicrobiota bacterium]